MNNTNKCICMPNDKYDRISSLPDEMLQHILSFLGIRQSVQTSVVSKRWVNLWTSLSHLNFDPHEFVLEDESDAKFKKFVEMLLSRHETSFLDNFQIKILDQYGCFDLVRTCVSYAMKVNPRVFSVEAPFFHKDICGPIFSCESIEELFLRKSNYPHRIPDFVNLPRIRRLQLTGTRLDNGCITIPDFVNLPRIRRLQLTRTRLDNGCITRLFSGCPVLEDVSLEYCSGEISCIFSQKLKYLSLCHCVFLRDYRLMCVDSCLLGDAVNSVIISRPFHVEFMWKSVGTTAVGNTFSFMRNVFHYFDFGDNIGGLSDVIVLKLHIKEMKHISGAAMPKLGEFHNLIDLCLGSWCMTCNLSPVALFLQQTPNLQKITLYMCARHCRVEETGIDKKMDHLMWVYLLRYLYGCKNLRQVEIKLFKDYIRVHKINKAVLPRRTQKRGIEIIVSEHI
ncbi:F-box domain containing protein [Carex littledalei]|uniref:F-box domain containing protein n=1 Tax=Carex littledalei TaxID=544730 RepID=A0A833VER9_9POAL|nr:F-box domain containing protein [Carex littledalei]